MQTVRSSSRINAPGTLLYATRERIKAHAPLANALRELRRSYRVTRSRLARRQTIAAYLESNAVRKLQIGAGTNELPGWLNTDLIPSSPRVLFLDATRRFPIPDRSIDYLASEHVIEHITYPQGLSMLREAYRVLKPGGTIRIATPDLETLIGLYTAAGNAEQTAYVRYIVDHFLADIGIYDACFVINNAFNNPTWGHQFIYDRKTLERSMETAGFTDLRRFAPGESSTPELIGIESHGKAISNEAMNQFETMVLEGRRPS